MQRALMVLLVLACAACTPGARRETTETPSSRRALQSNPEFPPDSELGPREEAMAGTETQARMRCAEVAAFLAQTRVLLPGWNQADGDMAAAQAALGMRDWGRALGLAEEASARADAALSDYYARLANEELRQVYAYTGLDDAQVLQLRAAEETLVAGNSRLAYGRLRTLNRQLEKRIKTYTVAAGDSLWVIAARPEIYANPLLWPLIWQANVAVIPRPERLRKGQVLRLRPHPSLDEVAEAVDYARGKVAKKSVTPRIGEIRERSAP